MNEMERENRRNEIAQMVSSYKNGNEEAFSELFEETWNDLTCFCRSRFDDFDEQRIDDVVQQAFVKIYKNIDDLDDPSKYMGWAFRIVRNTALDSIRREKKYVYMSKQEAEDGSESEYMSGLPDESEYSFPEDRVYASEIRKDITSALRTLSRDVRETFCLYYLEDMSVREIAEYQGTKEGTVKSRLFTARSRLREELEKYRDQL